jgi:hypothetical protein
MLHVSMKVLPKWWAHVPQWNESVHTIQKVSVKSGHLLLLFYKSFIPSLCISASIAESCIAPAVGVRSRSSQPALHGFLDCLVKSRSGDFSGDLSRARTNGSLRGPVPDCRVDGRAVPSCFGFLCTRKQTENPTEQILRYPKISMIS